ncbi:MAG: hypothetical protein ABIP93_20550 [Gemmatimonadaceae bacterium]
MAAACSLTSTEPPVRTAIALALFALLGCRGASTDVTQPSVAQAIAGNYALATIGAIPLPASYPPGLSITSSRIVVLAAGTWTEARSGIALGKVTTMDWSGTWTRSGSDVAFRVGPTALDEGALTSSGLRLTSGGTIFTYSRE